MARRVRTPQLEARSIVKKFGGLAAVKNVSFSVFPGEIVGLIGPNGAGKTTLLDVLWGFYKPASGWVKLSGKDLRRAEPWRRARMGIRRSFQGGRVPAVLRGYEHLALSSKARPPWSEVWKPLRRPGLPPNEDTERIESRLKLRSLYNLQGGEMSYGQRKRISLACVLKVDPKVALLDEPISGVDPFSRNLLAEAMQNAAKRGASILLVEHDMDFVREVCNRVIAMVEGELIADGRFEDVAQNRGLLGGYLGEP